MKKCAVFAYVLAVASLCALAAPVDQEAAESAANKFLATSSVAARILPGREVSGVTPRGRLWIAHLAPSGHIVIAGSTKCHPIVSFSQYDFEEPTGDSPCKLSLDAADEKAAALEQDETISDDSLWESKETGGGIIKKLKLLLASEPPETSAIIVEPLLNAAWNQSPSPYNDFTPKLGPCGCMATAGAQELRYWRWPYRFGGSRQVDHGMSNFPVAYPPQTIRVNGEVPLDYASMLPSYGAGATRYERYQAAVLILWAQSYVKMSFSPGSGGGTKKLCNEANAFGYEYGSVMSEGRDGYTNLWNAIKADLDYGSPIQVNTPGHQMVIDGYAIENEGTEDEVVWINTNYGWGGSICWEKLRDCLSTGRFADFQIGFRPRKMAEIDPLPPVSATSVPLSWHIPPCHTNAISGFDVKVYGCTNSTFNYYDYFSSSPGVASSTNTFRVVDGKLRGEAGADGIYTYPDNYLITETSSLEFSLERSYVVNSSVFVEGSFEGGDWETIEEIKVPGDDVGSENVEIDLAKYAGRSMQLRLRLAHTPSAYYYSGDTYIKIDELTLYNVYGFDHVAKSASVPVAGDETTDYAYTVEDLEDGELYSFTVTPVMKDGSDAVSTKVWTKIGSPLPAPSIEAISVIYDNIAILQDGFYAECGMGVTNEIVVTCSESTTALAALPSHITLLSDDKVSVEKNDNEFKVRLDTTEITDDWAGNMLMLTLAASNADGATAYTNMMLRLARPCRIYEGTYEVVADGVAEKPANFCGTDTDAVLDTVLDAKGHTLTFAEGTFMGRDNRCSVTLRDTAGGGGFVIDGLDDFSGTLKVDSSCSLTLAGNIPMTARIEIPSGVMVELAGVEVDPRVFTGEGELKVVSGTNTFVNFDAGTLPVSLHGGVLIVDPGDETTLAVHGGTLRVQLTDAHVAFGHSTTLSHLADSATVEFVDADGNNVNAVQDGLTFTVPPAETTRIWTPNAATSSYSDTSRWLGGVLPSNGEYAIFDIPQNATMNFDLPESVALEGLKITGGGRLTIAEATGNDNTLSATKLVNDTELVVQTSRIVDSRLLPLANVTLETATFEGCDVESHLAGTLKTADGKTALTSEFWRGTVIFTGRLANLFENENYWFNPDKAGNANSIVRLNGTSGYFEAGDPTFTTSVELVDNGDTPALDWNDGSSSSTATFKKLLGDGTFKTQGGGGNGEKIILNDITDFTGTFDLASKTVAIGNEVSTNATSGLLDIMSGYTARIAPGKTWRINGGVFLDGATAKLDVAGTLVTPTISALAENAQLVLSDGGLIEFSGIPSESARVDASLYAGTLRFTADATVADGACFSSTNSTWTTIDACGNELTFAAGAISGHGTIYPTSTAAERGSVTFEDLGCFAGTIIIDGTTDVHLPADLSQCDATLDLRTGEMSFAALSECRVKVGSGAKVTLTLTAEQMATGYSSSNVTLNGGTVEFRDAGGNLLATVTDGPATVKFATISEEGEYALTDVFGTIAEGGAYIVKAQATATLAVNGPTSVESIAFDVADGTTLTLTGGTLMASHGITVNGGGVLVTDVNTLSGTITGSGTLRYRTDIDEAGDYSLAGLFGSVGASSNFAIDVNENATLDVGGVGTLRSLSFNIAEGKTLTLTGGELTVTGGVTVRGKGTIRTSATNALTGTIAGDSTFYFDMENGTTKPAPKLAGWTSAQWTGTLWVENGVYCGWKFNDFGNENSILRLSNITCYVDIYGGTSETLNPTIELEGDGLKITDGNGGSVAIVKKLTGSGKLSIAGGSYWSGNAIVIQDAKEFTGSISTTSSCYHKVTFGMSGQVDKSGKIVVSNECAATIASGAVWSPVGGMEVSGTLAFAGTGTANCAVIASTGATLDFSAVSREDSLSPVSGALTLADGVSIILPEGAKLPYRLAASGDGSYSSVTCKIGDGESVTRKVVLAGGVLKVVGEATISEAGEYTLNGLYGAVVDSGAYSLNVEESASLAIAEETAIGDFIINVSADKTLTLTGETLSAASFSVGGEGSVVVDASARGEGLAAFEAVKLIGGPNLGSIGVTLPDATDELRFIRLDTGDGLYMKALPLDFRSININFTHNGNLSTENAVGLVGIPGMMWDNKVGANGTLQAVNLFDSATSTTNVCPGLQVVVSGSRGSYACTSLAAANELRHGYIDENANYPTPTVTISGIPFDAYRVIVYHATDTSGVKFGYDTINGDNLTYASGVLAPGTNSWGNAGGQNSALDIQEGVNTLVSGVYTNSTLTVVAHRCGSAARGCIAAIQVVVDVKTVSIDEEGTYNLADIAERFGDVRDGTELVLNVNESATLLVDDAAFAKAIRVNIADGKTLTLGGSGRIVFGSDPCPSLAFVTEGENKWTGTLVMGWKVANQSNRTSWMLDNYGISGSTVEVVHDFEQGYFKNPDGNAPSVAPAVYFAGNVTINDGYANPNQITTFSSVGMAEGKTFKTRENQNATYYKFSKLDGFYGTLEVPNAGHVEIDTIVCDAMPAPGEFVAKVTIGNGATLDDPNNVVVAVRGREGTIPALFVTNAVDNVSGFIAKSQSFSVPEITGTIVTVMADDRPILPDENGAYAVIDGQSVVVTYTADGAYVVDNGTIEFVADDETIPNIGTIIGGRTTATPAVACVGSTFYKILQAAVNAAAVASGGEPGETETVVLLADNEENLTLEKGKSVTINANGHMYIEPAAPEEAYTFDAVEVSDGVTTYTGRDWYEWNVTLGECGDAIVTGLPVSVMENAETKTIAFTVTPDATYKVTRVTVSSGELVAGENGEYSYEVSGDAVVTVETELYLVTLSVPAAEHASFVVTVDGVAQQGEDGVYTLIFGSEATVTYTADKYYEITENENAVQIFEMTGDAAAVAPTVVRSMVVVTVPAVDGAALTGWTSDGGDVTRLEDGTLSVPAGSTLTLTWEVQGAYVLDVTTTTASIGAEPVELSDTSVAAPAKAVAQDSNGKYYTVLEDGLGWLFSNLNVEGSYLDFLGEPTGEENVYGGYSIGYDASNMRYAKAAAMIQVDDAESFPGFLTVQEAIDTAAVAANEVSDEKVTLLSDCEENLTLANGKAVTINANGHTYNAPVAPEGAYTFDVAEVSEGVTTYTGRDWYEWTASVAASSSPNATVTGLPASVVECENEETRTITFTVTADALYRVTGVTVSSGELVAGENGQYTYEVSGDAEVTVATERYLVLVTVPEITGTVVTVMADGEAVEGENGVYTVGRGKSVVVTYAADGEYVVEGDAIEFVPDDDTDLGEGEWSLPVSKPAVALVGTTYYTTLQAAVNAAAVASGGEPGETETVVLLADNVEALTLEKGKSVTIDANGHTYIKPAAPEGAYTFDAVEVSDGVTTYTGRDWYEWNVTLGECGDATVTGLPVSVMENAETKTIAFAVTPDATYKVTRVTVSSGELVAGENGEYSYEVSGDAVVTVETELYLVTLSVPAVEHASFVVTVDGVAQQGEDGVYTLIFGSEATVTYTADEYYEITENENAVQIFEMTGDADAVAPTVVRSMVVVTVPAVDGAALTGWTSDGGDVTRLEDGTLSVPAGSTLTLTWEVQGAYVLDATTTTASIGAEPVELSGTSVAAPAKAVAQDSNGKYYTVLGDGLGWLFSNINVEGSYLDFLGEPTGEENVYGGWSIGYDATTKRYAKAAAVIRIEDTANFPGFLTAQKALDAAADGECVRLTANNNEFLTIAKGRTVTIEANHKDGIYTYNPPESDSASYTVDAVEISDGVTKFTARDWYVWTASVAASSSPNATVTGLPASVVECENEETRTITFTVTADALYRVTGVTVSSGELVAGENGQYTYEVSGDAEVTVATERYLVLVTVPEITGTVVTVMADGEAVEGENGVYTVGRGKSVVVTYAAAGEYVVEGDAIEFVPDDDTDLDEDGWTLPVSTPAVALVGTTYYTTLQAAVNAAAVASGGEPGEPVVLLADSVETLTLEKGKSVTINANGHMYIAPAAPEGAYTFDAVEVSDDVTTYTGRDWYEWTVVYANWDGEELQRYVVSERAPAMPEYTGAVPARESTPQYSYSFSGWGDVADVVTGDVTYTAQFVATTRTYTVTWLDDDGTELGVSGNVPYGTLPAHDNPAKVLESPYRQDFADWSPAIETVTSNTVYRATFHAIFADISTLEGDWEAKDGDVIRGTTEHAVNIPGGATVTINGVRVAGMGGGAAPSAPEFAEDAASEISRFERTADGKWTITTWIEIANDASGMAVVDDKVKVYGADSIEELATAEPMEDGVSLKEKKSAVKMTHEVSAPDGADAQFFKVVIEE